MTPATKATYEARLAAGMCGKCGTGKRYVSLGKLLTTCLTCSRKAIVWRDERKQKRYASGMCMHTRCIRKAHGAGDLCLTHETERSRKAKESYIAKKAARVCVQSGCNNPADTGVLCATCKRGRKGL